ncbi:MAG: hypothetical protein ACOYL5_07305 [Phototrophicaceae bacterium]|jgi:hypothetical protein
MTRVLVIFIDGIGIGEDIPARNPFSSADMSTLTALTNGKRWVQGIGRQDSARATFIPTDPRMGIPGRPQSGTGQATIISGKNVPALVGEHYGPKPNLATREVLAKGTIFNDVVARGKKAALISAYPPHLHQEIKRGKYLPSSYQQAVLQMGLPMFGVDDLRAGRALSEDWTGEAWRRQMGFTDTPLYTPEEAGARMVTIARQYDFAFFSHWMSDVIGHRGTLEDGVKLLELLNRVMRGVLNTWQDDEGVIVLTSDHGNMENLADRHHTENDVPTLIVGNQRHTVAEGLTTLADIVPGLRRVLFHESKPSMISPTLS